MNEIERLANAGTVAEGGFLVSLDIRVASTPLLCGAVWVQGTKCVVIGGANALERLAAVIGVGGRRIVDSPLSRLQHDAAGMSVHDLASCLTTS
ncbi:hypothetical protein [Kutzneria buriramensis]|uniref:hypothetical protein n=1 Tax=Kutzneria buriramensis TaxID=1045776 RepID=UPI0011C1544F|nr:hypothetical protein [Kutzneria buriramensis]